MCQAKRNIAEKGRRLARDQLIDRGMARGLGKIIVRDITADDARKRHDGARNGGAIHRNQGQIAPNWNRKSRCNNGAAARQLPGIGALFDEIILRRRGLAAAALHIMGGIGDSCGDHACVKICGQAKRA